MIIKNNIKYACEPCIKGHKVAGCDHSDRPLIQVKRKGRPSTACFHCKELRMVRNVNPSGSCKCHSKKATSSCGCTEGNPCKCHTRRKRGQNKVSEALDNIPNFSINTPTSLKDEDINALLDPLPNVFSSVVSSNNECQNITPPTMTSDFSTKDDKIDSFSKIHIPIEDLNRNNNSSLYDLNGDLHDDESWSLSNPTLGDLSNYNILDQNFGLDYSFRLDEVGIDEQAKIQRNDNK
ncbi:similar to Saccharomyces cerevisiae YGL166W CUP2 Copper-binding transcription factor [Maudiozyma saulgeensis]|uniref:Similar to Saccharomyces cerevisiae YGL166W CUP2 Copper-binding transcription factor n=1 Tax=Maudiozyma saulgeensis TaxID=1789683 RepID=A0A1X7QYQ9_9SACH|nr:similar to Saccharomyces cerevisiae YGL166W CUP2 Copper-binding transcription factor [Kazachstania saulgeensis]